MAGETLGTHPPIACEKDGVAFDVAVDDALVVQVGQGSQDRQADRGYLLLIHPGMARWKNELSVKEDSGKVELAGTGIRAPSQPARSFRQWLCGVILWSCFCPKRGDER